MVHKMKIPVGIQEEKDKKTNSVNNSISTDQLQKDALQAYSSIAWHFKIARDITADNFNDSGWNFKGLSNFFYKCGNFLLLCDQLMSRDALDNHLRSVAVTAEEYYDHLVKAFVDLPLDKKLALLDTDKDGVKIQNIEEVINTINGIRYFPQEEKNKIIEEMKNLKIDVNQKYDDMHNRNVFSILATFIGVILIACGIHWGINKYLWHWMIYVFWLFVLGYFIGSIQCYKQLNSVRKTRKDRFSLKLLLGAFTFFGND